MADVVVAIVDVGSELGRHQALGATSRSVLSGGLQPSTPKCVPLSHSVTANFLPTKHGVLQKTVASPTVCVCFEPHM
jgi:hypothetical protein